MTAPEHVRIVRQARLTLAGSRVHCEVRTSYNGTPNTPVCFDLKSDDPVRELLSELRSHGFSRSVVEAFLADVDGR